ncbi:serine hydrolase domain-containing protein [Methylibium petroleiphilum]|uniref:serine hydrolase domain-containing protein n=1 Tax=Methylibium petroleiphilum TaxID=105560 RepID=UPI001AC5EB0E|nr:serine hydrolase domain-containing protein [Methylibium petroleiphilum]MBN9203094.1 beta-lactamase family protein [Methylibium petroleiphilum]
MHPDFSARADALLEHITMRADGVPGVVAMVSDGRELLYQGAAGRRELGREAPMTLDTVLCLFSCTKAITGVALMQLVEEGLVGLDDPVYRHVPEIAEIEVLEGFTPAGEPITRPPRSPVTVGQLMLHTAGFGYEFFDPDDLKFRRARGIPNVVSCRFDAIRTVLLSDPGERWHYGCSIDWVGKVVEAVRGRPLGQVMAERIFGPLDMRDTAFVLTPSMQSRRATVHGRSRDGLLRPLANMMLPQPPEMHMGGQGLYGTAGDYMKFIRMVLNNGDGPRGRVLEAATVDFMSRRGPPAPGVGGWTTAAPPLANAGEFFPGLRKSWAYTFMVNDEDTPTGRPAGSLMWTGLGNLYYWIDRKNRIGGFWGTQILPFQDVASYPGFVDFESAVYRTLKR